MRVGLGLLLLSVFVGSSPASAEVVADAPDGRTRLVVDDQRSGFRLLDLSQDGEERVLASGVLEGILGAGWSPWTSFLVMDRGRGFVTFTGSISRREPRVLCVHDAHGVAVQCHEGTALMDASELQTAMNPPGSHDPLHWFEGAWEVPGGGRLLVVLRTPHRDFRRPAFARPWPTAGGRVVVVDLTSGRYRPDGPTVEELVAGARHGPEPLREAMLAHAVARGLDERQVAGALLDDPATPPALRFYAAEVIRRTGLPAERIGPLRAEVDRVLAEGLPDDPRYAAPAERLRLRALALLPTLAEPEPLLRLLAENASRPMPGRYSVGLGSVFAEAARASSSGVQRLRETAGRVGTEERLPALVGLGAVANAADIDVLASAVSESDSWVQPCAIAGLARAGRAGEDRLLVLHADVAARIAEASSLSRRRDLDSLRRSLARALAQAESEAVVKAFLASLSSGPGPHVLFAMAAAPTGRAVLSSLPVDELPWRDQLFVAFGEDAAADELPMLLGWLDAIPDDAPASRALANSLRALADDGAEDAVMERLRAQRGHAGTIGMFFHGHPHPEALAATTAWALSFRHGSETAGLLLGAGAGGRMGGPPAWAETVAPERRAAYRAWGTWEDPGPWIDDGTEDRMLASLENVGLFVVRDGVVQKRGVNDAANRGHRAARLDPRTITPRLLRWWAEDPGVARDAVLAGYLRARPAPEGFEMLLDAWGRAEAPAHRGVILGALAAFDDPGVVPLLQEGLRTLEPGDTASRSAIDELGRRGEVGEAAALELILEGSLFSESLVRVALIAGCTDPRWPAALHDLLRSADPERGGRSIAVALARCVPPSEHPARGATVEQWLEWNPAE